MECFVINSNKIERILGAEYYKPIYRLNKNKIKSSHYKYVKLETLCEIITKGETPLWRGDSYQKEGILFIKSENVLENELVVNNPVYIADSVHERMKRSQLKYGDVLLNIVGASIGRSCIFNLRQEGNINQAVCLIRLKSNLNSFWLSYLLNSDFFQLILKQNQSGGARDNIDLYQVRELLVPVHTKDIQDRIVTVMDKAYSQKKSKEYESLKLLVSINDYVLDELGIKLPNIVKKMCFTAFSEEVKGHRIDPKKYTERPKAILKAIQESKYTNEKLSTFVLESIAGEWGEEPYNELIQSSDYILCKVLRNTNFVNKTNLDLTDVVERLINKTKFNKIHLRDGDLLIEKSGGSPIQPVGRVAIIERMEGNYTFSNFLQCLRINENICLPRYLFSFLKAVYSLNYMEYIQNQTTGIKNLIMEEFLSIPVCRPPRAVQNKIAEEVKARMQKAEQLQKEAKEELEKAKKEVEKIILGKSE